MQIFSEAGVSDCFCRSQRPTPNPGDSWDTLTMLCAPLRSDLSSLHARKFGRHVASALWFGHECIWKFSWQRSREKHALYGFSVINVYTDVRSVEPGTLRTSYLALPTDLSVYHWQGCYCGYVTIHTTHFPESILFFALVLNYTVMLSNALSHTHTRTAVAERRRAR